MSWVDVRLGPFDAADQTPPPVSHVPLAALAAAPLGPWLMGLIAGLGKAPCGRGQASRRSRAPCGPSALPPREGDRPLLMGRFKHAATLGHRERPGKMGPPRDPRGRQCPSALRRPVWVQASPSSRGPPPRGVSALCWQPGGAPRPARLFGANSAAWARRSPRSPRLPVPPVQPREKPGEPPPGFPSLPVALWYWGGDLEEGQCSPTPRGARELP